MGGTQRTHGRHRQTSRPASWATQVRRRREEAPRCRFEDAETIERMKTTDKKFHSRLEMASHVERLLGEVRQMRRQEKEKRADQKWSDGNTEARLLWKASDR